MSEYSEYTERIYRGSKRHEIRAEIKVTLTPEAEEAPSLQACRYAVLPLGRKGFNGKPAYAIYDRVLNRIVDGVYYTPLSEVRSIAAGMNAPGAPPYERRSPNGVALGLIYPTAEDPTYFR